MENHGRRATILGIVANAFLFSIKLTAGLMSGSLALLSDAANSFSDTIYSVAIFIAVRISGKKADRGHPFGHHRAEPVVGLLIAILAGILGFEIIKTGVIGIIDPSPMAFTLFGAIVLITTMIIKAAMWVYFKRIALRINSPAIHAASIDSRNDILLSFTALLGICGPLIGMASLDYYAGIAIGLFIIWSGYDIGKKNIDYLMGASPDEEILTKIRKRALSIKGVRGTNDIRAHYVGNYLHAEVHVEINKSLHADKAHDICKAVQHIVEAMSQVDKAFVHLDPR
jgi:cation diffusion facilitator family transporter